MLPAAMYIARQVRPPSANEIAARRNRARAGVQRAVPEPASVLRQIRRRRLRHSWRRRRAAGLVGR